MSKKVALSAVSMFICLSTLVAQSQLSVSALFSDRMVLQQNDRVTIWGWNKPGVAVTLSPSWGDPITISTDEVGKWETILATPSGGVAHSLSITDKEKTIHISNILMGEVWVCSGQSNMPLGGWPPTDTISNYLREIMEVDLKFRMMAICFMS